MLTSPTVCSCRSANAVQRRAGTWASDDVRVLR